LQQGRLDLLAGGIQSSPSRAIRFEPSRGYLPVNLALVVPDAKVRLLQGGRASRLGRPVILAVRDPDIIGDGLEQVLARYLSDGNGAVDVDLVPIADKEEFFTPAGQRRYDGLLTSAESGAAWAVMHPHIPDHPLREGSRLGAGAADRRRRCLPAPLHQWLAHPRDLPWRYGPTVPLLDLAAGRIWGHKG
jgi:hypothetical protein